MLTPIFGFDFKFLILIWICSTSLMVTLRFFFKDILLGLRHKDRQKLNVIIYGAGEAGRQLVISLKNNPEFKVIGFLDDNEKLIKLSNGKNEKTKKILFDFNQTYIEQTKYFLKPNKKNTKASHFKDSYNIQKIIEKIDFAVTN